LAAVGWKSEWGEARPAPSGSIGPSGTWAEEHILAPLGLVRSAACISDCFDTARLNSSQAKRVNDTYVPIAELLGLPASTLRAVPGGEGAIVREARTHYDRVRAELRRHRPTTVVTLGNAALRVMGEMTEEPNSARRALTRDSYGQTLRAALDGHRFEWLPLVHPRSPGSRRLRGRRSTPSGGATAPLGHRSAV
jgi:hypothetical protein